MWLPVFTPKHSATERTPIRTISEKPWDGEDGNLALLPSRLTRVYSNPTRRSQHPPQPHTSPPLAPRRSRPRALISNNLWDVWVLGHVGEKYWRGLGKLEFKTFGFHFECKAKQKKIYNLWAQINTSCKRSRSNWDGLERSIKTTFIWVLSSLEPANKNNTEEHTKEHITQNSPVPKENLPYLKISLTQHFPYLKIPLPTRESHRRLWICGQRAGVVTTGVSCRIFSIKEATSSAQPKEKLHPDPPWPYEWTIRLGLSLPCPFCDLPLRTSRSTRMFLSLAGRNPCAKGYSGSRRAFLREGRKSLQRSCMRFTTGESRVRPRLHSSRWAMPPTTRVLSFLGTRKTISLSGPASALIDIAVVIFGKSLPSLINRSKAPLSG